MDRELLIEIGCEELPASWLPGLTRQVGEAVKVRLAESRLTIDAPIEAFSTPRRLTVCVAKVAERQTDFEELVTGPPVSAAFDASGQPTGAALGFARKQGVEVSALDQIATPKGIYLGVRKKLRGKPTVDVLPDVLAAVLRDLSFPKAMHWDAWIDDGRGELLFGRPIRWILFLYGGRVVPFEIRRSEQAQSPQVQDVRSAAVTYGHRFLTTSGRAGRAIKVRSFDDYRARLLENFVVLDRDERHDRITRELEAKARKLSGRVASGLVSRSALEEVPDLIEYPSVIAGFVQEEFLKLPPEVLTTTLVHHQHYFPVVDDAGRLKNAFLAVTNTDSANEKTVARNAERVVTARLRDARFFWEADRRITLEDRVDRLETILFHKKLGTYRAKAERLEALAAWIAAEALTAAHAVDHARRAGRLAKADLVTDMVREFTELQGTMGGIYAREEGQPEAVWKAIYYHYLPVATEPDAPPGREELGAAAVAWAAVSLADKLDTVAGMFLAGEKPTGSRDPFGLRRQAHGVLRVLMDLPELTGLRSRPTLHALVSRAAEPFLRLGLGTEGLELFWTFLLERYQYMLEQRGFDVRNVRAVVHEDSVRGLNPLSARLELEALPEFTESPDFRQLAIAFKRVRNIARELPDGEFAEAERRRPPLALIEPAERALLAELDRRAPVIEQVLKAGDNYRGAFAEAARFGPAVDRFFTEVFVMVEDRDLRNARLCLMKRLERLILKLADVSEIVREKESSQDGA
jgi:glycyl-tRNA synthetase beta chain